MDDLERAIAHLATVTPTTGFEEFEVNVRGRIARRQLALARRRTVAATALIALTMGVVGARTLPDATDAPAGLLADGMTLAPSSLLVQV
jgi:hypothetical protein